MVFPPLIASNPQLYVFSSLVLAHLFSCRRGAVTYNLTWGALGEDSFSPFTELVSWGRSYCQGRWFREWWGPGTWCSLSPGLCKFLKEVSLLLDNSRDLCDFCSCLTWVHSAWRLAMWQVMIQRKIHASTPHYDSEICLTSWNAHILDLSSIADRFILNMNTSNPCTLLL